MFDGQLGIIKEANPDVLLLASFPPENPIIVKQAREMGIKSIFIGSDGWDHSLMLDILEDNTLSKIPTIAVSPMNLLQILRMLMK